MRDTLLLVTFATGLVLLVVGFATIDYRAGAICLGAILAGLAVGYSRQ